ncbi:MAG: hypothetical protein WBX50_01400 [Candidatus Deferrimicrobiaceae bacterium]
MIEAAVILSAVARHWPDFGVILLLLVANAVVGFREEHQAGNAIAALKAKLAIKARVKRDGKWTTPEARELVPGDVIRVRLGDIVPADARLLEGDPVEVDQSVPTGESLPATRKPGEAVFSGSIFRQGEIGARGGGHRADDARPVGNHRRDQGKPQNLPADEQLRDPPHRRDAARAVVHDAGNPGV